MYGFTSRVSSRQTRHPKHYLDANLDCDAVAALQLIGQLRPTYRPPRLSLGPAASTGSSSKASYIAPVVQSDSDASG
jgi:hypothetical protein